MYSLRLHALYCSSGLVSYNFGASAPLPSKTYKSTPHINIPSTTEPSIVALVVIATVTYIYKGVVYQSVRRIGQRAQGQILPGYHRYPYLPLINTAHRLRPHRTLDSFQSYYWGIDSGQYRNAGTTYSAIDQQIGNPYD